MEHLQSQSIGKKAGFFGNLQAKYNFLLGIRAFFRVCKDIHRLDEIIAVSNKIAVSRPQLIVGLMSFIRNQDGLAARALQERPRVGKLSLQTLKNCPEGSLGRGLAEYLTKNNLNPEDLPMLVANNETEFVRAHFFETHDVWHVVTGFDTSVDGEMGLQAFGIAQYPIALNCLNLAAGIINMAIFSPESRLSRMDQIVKGWQMGRRAKPFFGIHWSQMWDLPLDTVRKDLGIQV